MGDDMICEVCGKPTKRRGRSTGAYWVHVCECGLEFFVDKGDKNFMCPEFVICAIAGRIHCKDCSHNKARNE
ncbi:MAG: hypothetical protein A4E63_01747 [Syntrophorhabdus sp. PtaU1.Bin050]|nr:MAG: hypothetical protein A4E63_01747 [Syntrophorhabdus sp. PtaU1.Bin050]